MKSENCVKVCNSLLRGERSAVETYDKVLEKFNDRPFRAELMKIRQEHSESVSELEKNVISMGGLIDLESGLWGVTAQAAQETANMLGHRPALETLRTGENAGKSDYESALENEDVMPECKDLIQSTLLPRVIGHISVLDRIKAQPA